MATCRAAGSLAASDPPLHGGGELAPPHGPLWNQPPCWGRPDLHRAFRKLMYQEPWVNRSRRMR